ncbi:MAG: hypothetical protein ACYTER_07325 [Planctomycetota bacterium]|jgi:hypothetical protein
MEKQISLSLVGLIVVITVVVFVMFNIYLFSTQYHPARKVTCSNNLKDLSVAMIVYASDYDDEYPQLAGKGPWSKELGFDYDNVMPDFNDETAEGNVPRTITASLYMLVRESDVSPKSFVCPESTTETEFDGSNSYGLDIVELWDFGNTPHDHVSYAYHNPYGKFPPDGIRSAAFAIVADMSPWFQNGDIVGPDPNNLPPQIITQSNPTTWPTGMGQHHNSKGQNVSFGDGYVAYETAPNIGVKNDNIYTFWSTENHPTKQDTQGGTAPTSRDEKNDAKSKDDSFLAI